jgi:hypothetical protein
MDPATAALMILLSCTPDGHDCREMLGPDRFETMAACREALPPVLKRMRDSARSLMGRCELAADHPADVDPVITGSTGHGSAPVETADESLTTVNVTRFIEGRLVTDAHRVPKVP